MFSNRIFQAVALGVLIMTATAGKSVPDELDVERCNLEGFLSRFEVSKFFEVSGRSITMVDQKRFGSKFKRECIWSPFILESVSSCTNETYSRYQNMIGVQPNSASPEFERLWASFSEAMRRMGHMDGFFYEWDGEVFKITEVQFPRVVFPERSEIDTEKNISWFSNYFVAVSELAKKFCNLSELPDSDFEAEVSKFR